MWLLRDFTLELNGSPSQYLEQSLSVEEHSSYTSSSQPESKKIKNQIVRIFKDRSCFTLVRPVSEESDLQKLNELPDHALRRDFINGVNRLK